MSRRYDIICQIATFCAEREIEQSESVELIHDVLDVAGQSAYDYCDEKSVEEEMKNIQDNVASIYGRVIGYKTP